MSKTRSQLIEAAKIIQPIAEGFAGRNGGARVYPSPHTISLRVLLWTEDAYHHSPEKISNDLLDIIPSSELISTVEVLTPDEYEERYFFTKPPFCREG